ncbi:MAG TPA: hypothetical protein VGJ73_04675 [Verrucomicrobiae bacterium]|jgi:hypothetical protein
MNIPTQRFCFHSLLITVGVALVIYHTAILGAYGLGLFLLSFNYSGYRKGKYPNIWWIVALTALFTGFYIWDWTRGDAFVRRPIPSWLEILFAAVWAFDLTIEFRGWLAKSRIASRLPY